MLFVRRIWGQLDAKGVAYLLSPLFHLTLPPRAHVPAAQKDGYICQVLSTETARENIVE